MLSPSEFVKQSLVKLDQYVDEVLNKGIPVNRYERHLVILIFFVGQALLFIRLINWILSNQDLDQTPIN